MNEIIERLKSKSPIFFKKLQKLSLSIGGSMAAVIVANGSIPLTLPDILINILSYVVAICVAIAGTAQLTKRDGTN